MQTQSDVAARGFDCRPETEVISFPKRNCHGGWINITF